MIKIIKNVIILLIVSAFFVEFLAESSGYGVYASLGLFPKKYIIIVDVLSGLLSLLIVMHIGITKRKLKTYINSQIIFFIFVCIPVGLLEVSNILIFISGIRAYFRALPLFFAISYFDEIDQVYIKKILKLFLIVALIQTPVVIYQRITQPNFMGGDIFCGTFGGLSTGVLGLYLVGVFSVVWAFYLHGLLNIWMLAASTSSVILVASLSQISIVYGLLLIIIIYAFLYYPKVYIKIIPTLKKFSVVIILILAIGIIGFRVYSSYYGDPISSYKIDYLKSYYQRQYDPTGLSRAESLRFAVDNVLSQPLHTLWGVGIGNASHSFFQDYEGDYYKKYKNLLIDKIFLGRIIWEFGFVGTMVWFIMLYKLYRLSTKVYHQDKDIFNRALGYGGKFLIIIALASIIYQDTLIRTQFIYPFWFYMGYLQRIRNKQI